jgi:hypothetical protein
MKRLYTEQSVISNRMASYLYEQSIEKIVSLLMSTVEHDASLEYCDIVNYYCHEEKHLKPMPTNRVFGIAHIHDYTINGVHHGSRKDLLEHLDWKGILNTYGHSIEFLIKYQHYLPWREYLEKRDLFNYQLYSGKPEAVHTTLNLIKGVSQQLHLANSLYCQSFPEFYVKEMITFEKFEEMSEKPVERFKHGTYGIYLLLGNMRNTAVYSLSLIEKLLSLVYREDDHIDVKVNQIVDIAGQKVKVNERLMWSGLLNTRSLPMSLIRKYKDHFTPHHWNLVYGKQSIDASFIEEFQDKLYESFEERHDDAHQLGCVLRHNKRLPNDLKIRYMRLGGLIKGESEADILEFDKAMLEKHSSYLSDIDELEELI